MDNKAKTEKEEIKITKTLAIMKNKETEKRLQDKVNKEITIVRIEEEETYQEDGTKIIKTIRKPINITRKINETAKVLKQMSAQEKLKLIAQTIK